MYIIMLLWKENFHDFFFIFKYHIGYEKAKRHLTLNDGMF
jgi:hypothetical protein